MKILAIDIGTGTQDILLFDTSTEVENCLRFIMPSPTVLVANQIRAATARGGPVLLTGTIMGGGPSAWAAQDHLRAGYPVYATPDAGRSFDDDLAQVEKSGIRIIGEEEAHSLPAARVELRDLDLAALRRAFEAFGIGLAYDALAVAVFDHGNSPPGYSDRLFRFDFIAERLSATDKLSGFAFMREQIPPRLTRMRAVAQSAPADAPLLLMDTAPAAILGALDDQTVRSHSTRLVANLGNFHTLAFSFSDGIITGVFEHHTGELHREQLEGFLRELAGGTLMHRAIFDSQGHGALVLDPQARPLDFLAVVGPRRGLLLNSPLRPYFAVPYGDMMLSGAFGLLRAYADLNPEAGQEITRSLDAARPITR